MCYIIVIIMIIIIVIVCIILLVLVVVVVVVVAVPFVPFVPFAGMRAASTTRAARKSVNIAKDGIAFCRLRKDPRINCRCLASRQGHACVAASLDTHGLIAWVNCIRSMGDIIVSIVSY